MKITKKRVFSFIFLLALSLFQISLLLHAQPAAAQNNGSLLQSQVGLNDVAQKFTGSNDVTNVQDIRVSIINILNVVLGFLGIIMLVLIIFSGYQWMTAGGNEEQVEKAKKRITNAVIGLVIVLASWTIANAVMRKVICATQNVYDYTYCSSYTIF